MALTDWMARARRSGRGGRLALMLFALALGAGITLGACGADADARRRADALANDTTMMEPGAVREPIPAGIDPAMVEWRSDGKLIASRDSLLRTPGYVVDSIFPPEEALRRFQAEAGEPVTALRGGSSTADALLREYWRLLVQGDSLGMTPLVVSQSEFAYLYFPESAEPATGLQPHVSWLLLQNNSGRGLSRAMALASSSAPELRGTICMPQTLLGTTHTIYGPCGIIRTRDAQPDTVWIAKHIIERDGVFKLMSFFNEL